MPRAPSPWSRPRGSSTTTSRPATCLPEPLFSIPTVWRRASTARDTAGGTYRGGMTMAGKQAFAKNIDVLAYHDVDGKPWFQMAMQEVDGRYYLYGAHFKHPGWAIVDVTDPTRPEYLKFVPGPDLPGQGTPK